MEVGVTIGTNVNGGGVWQEVDLVGDWPGRGKGCGWLEQVSILLEKVGDGRVG